MTMQWCFDMRIKQKSALEGIWIYYIKNMVNHLHVRFLAIFNGHPQGGVIQQIYYKDIKHQYTDIKYEVLKCVLKY